MITNELVPHAVKHVWPSIDQDYQHIFEPARLSLPEGERGMFIHRWEQIGLPNGDDRFHVFQIGQLFPKLLDLTLSPGQWFRVDQLMRTENVIIDVYNLGGLMFPRFEVWMQKTLNRNLLVAVKQQSHTGETRKDRVFVRFYSNAFFASDRSDPNNHRIETRGLICRDSNEALLIQHEYHNWQARPFGHASMFHNGVHVKDIRPANIVPGDALEIIYDSTVKAVVDLPVVDLKSFTSIRDSRRKWLLHYDGAQQPIPMLDYHDDIDVYLIRRTGTETRPNFEGRLFHRNDPASFRQVTHRDYSISVPQVHSFVESTEGWSSPEELTVRLIIRHSGFERPLVPENSRIHELYKLPADKIERVMLGEVASVDEWLAWNLENSALMRMLDKRQDEITPELVLEAYGYNATAKAFADTPIKVEVRNGRRMVSVPAAYRRNSTVYEYSASGLLLASHYHSNGHEYRPWDDRATLVEFIAGMGSIEISQVTDVNGLELQTGVNYRLYYAPRNAGQVIHSQTRDVTGNEEYALIVDNRLQWMTHVANSQSTYRDDTRFLAYDLKLAHRNGLLRFSVESVARYGDERRRTVEQIPFGRLDLWLNKHALIQGLDYYVNWPEVVIVNKRYLDEGDEQTITIRATGFCDDQIQMVPARDFGFLKYGRLSRNRRFNVRDDKVQRIIVNGKLLPHEALAFDEEYCDCTVEGVPNGSPYQVDDMMIPMRIGKDPYVAKAESEELDLRVEDYMTQELPERVYNEIDAIPGWYPVFSPFCSAILHDLRLGIIRMDEFKDQYSDLSVRRKVESYIELLQYDPCLQGVEESHVIIHPHDRFYEIELDIYQYNFLERVIRLFLQNRVDLTHFVRVKEGWF